MITELLNRCGFTGVTIYPTTKNQWQASVRRAGSDGWMVAVADTPAEALADALARPAFLAKPQGAAKTLADMM